MTFWQDYEKAYLQNSDELPGWEHSVFDSIKLRRQEETQFLESKADLVEGLLPCPHCQNTKTFCYEKQTRRADEGATVFILCYQCGRTTKHS